LTLQGVRLDEERSDGLIQHSSKTNNLLLVASLLTANLASTFVNGFVNAGFNTDKLLTVEESDWLYKVGQDDRTRHVSSVTTAIFLVFHPNPFRDSLRSSQNKEHGMLSATASLGLLMLWNVEEGLTVIDKVGRS